MSHIDIQTKMLLMYYEPLVWCSGQNEDSLDKKKAPFLSFQRSLWKTAVEGCISILFPFLLYSVGLTLY